MSTTDQLLKNNERFAQGFDRGDLPLPPAKKIAIGTITMGWCESGYGRSRVRRTASPRSCASNRPTALSSFTPLPP